MSCVSKKLDTLRLLIGLLMMAGDASFWGQLSLKMIQLLFIWAI